MGGSSSESRTSSNTSTTNEDNRVVADAGGVALAKGSTLNYNFENEFSDNVYNAFQELVDLARDAGQVAIEANAKAMTTAENSLNAVAKNAEILQKQEEQGEKTVITDIFPVIAVAVLGIVAVMVFTGKKK